MIQLLRRTWEDIRHGENIDLYVTVTVATVLTALNLVGLAPQSWLGPVTLAVLGLLAVTALGNRYRLEQALEKLAQMSLGPSVGLKIYNHWNVKEVYDVISSASASVVIIESWVAEAATLSSHIRDASDRTNKRLNVEVYMLDPDRQFGAQRFAEVGGHSDGTETVWREKFREKFTDTVDTLKRHLSGAQNVRLAIYKYATMPTLRMYIVDDREFFFGWFPANGPSSQNVCFHFTASLSVKENHWVVDSLRSQLEGIRKASQSIELGSPPTRR